MCTSEAIVLGRNDDLSMIPFKTVKCSKRFEVINDHWQ